MPNTIKLKFRDSGNANAQVKDTPVEWKVKYENGTTTEGTTSTNNSGFLEIPGVELDDKPEVYYTIGGVSGMVTGFKGIVLEKFVNVKITGAAAVVPVAVQEQIDLPPVRDRVPILNTNRDWLSYESLFNRLRNRKSNKKFQMGLYVLERGNVTVWFRDNLSRTTLRNLTAAFFPDYEPRDHLIFSNHIWEWKKLEEMREEITPRTKRRIVASGKQYKVNLDSFVVLPYNAYDNGISSRALGTKKLNDFSRQLKDNLKWDFWKTASRSCVVRVKRIKDKDADWETVVKPIGTEWAWDYSVGEPERTKHLKNDVNFLLDKPLDGTGWKLSEFTNSGDTIDVSLKTGVIFVGSEQQSGSGKKDFLDENWIVACLRSDYVVAVNKELEAKGVFAEDDKQLIVLTELLSITEKTPRDESTEEEINYKTVKVELMVNDGIQVRDLSALDKSKIYLAPLNIPHVDTDLKEFKDEFACFGDANWREFWRKHWARSLGRAKALFLLRYGLQHINPNPQNYLIEFAPAGEHPKPTGKIIIRDLQDAAIHREVVWALYGSATEPPPEGEANRSKLAKVYQPVIEYEFGKIPGKSQETGTIDKTQDFGPSGTQFLWQRFSAFGSGKKPAAMTSMQNDAEKWKLFLATMARWGKSHNRAYVRCIEHQLGVNLTEIDWDSMPSPDRYLNEDLKYAEIDKLCIDYDSDNFTENSENPPQITGVVGKTFPALVEQPPEDKTVAVNLKKENLTELFPAQYADKFEEVKGKLCLIVSGAGFVNPTAKIGEVEIETVMMTKDNSKVYLAVDETLKTVFERKTLPLTITNDDGGKAVYQFKAKSVTDMGWEEETAGKVHNYLKSKDGQRAIRAYKRRGWEPVKPKFRIKLLNENNQPVEEHRVRISGRNIASRTDITDENGEIHIYQDFPEECSIRILGYDNSPDLNGSFKVADIKKLNARTLDFKHLKIQYLEN